MINGGQPLTGEITAAGNKNAALADPRRVPAHRRGDPALQRAANPRHRGADRDPRRARRTGGMGLGPRAPPRRLRRHRRLARRGALGTDPRLVPARGAAPGPLRRGAHAAARRRLHRPPPPRPAPRRLHRHGRGDLGLADDRDHRARRRAQALRRLHGRAFRDGNRERPDGRRAHAGPDHASERRVRAARPGPGAPPREDGREDRRHRLERDDRSRPRQARRRRAPHLPRPHRGRIASWRSPRRPGETSASATRASTTST